MFVFGEILLALSNLMNMLFTVIYFLLVIRIVFSWFQVYSYNELIQTIYKITDIILKPFKRLPLQIGMIDFSPMVAFIVLTVLNSLIVNILRRLALNFLG